MMTRYQDLLKIRLSSNPCPICFKRPEFKDTKAVKLNDKMVRVCKHHHIDGEEEQQPQG